MSALRVTIGSQRSLDDALAARIGNLRKGDPLAPITVLVGASLQRPYLTHWLAGELGGHANLRILMPGDLALLLGAPVLVAAGRRALPPLADRVLLAEVAAGHAGYFARWRRRRGSREALYRLVRELKGAAYDVSDLEALLDGATDAPAKAAALAEILAAFEARRRQFYGPDDALLAADASRLGGLALLVTGMLELPPALERCAEGDFGADAGRAVLARHPGGSDTPLAQLRARLEAEGALSARRTPRARR